MAAKLSHILIIPSWYPNQLHNKGSFVEDQARALANSGSKIVVFLFEMIRPFDRAVIKWKKEEALEYIDVKFRNWIPTRLSAALLNFQKNLVLNKIGSSLKKYIKLHGKPDIIHLHSIVEYGYVTKYLSERFNIPYVLTEHYPFEAVSYDPIFNAYETMANLNDLVLNAKSRISVSPHYQRLYSDKFNCEFNTIPNLIPMFFSKQEKKEAKRNGKFIFLSVGALIARKGHALLIRAFAKAFGGESEYVLQIVGSGKLYDELITLPQHLDIEGQVNFLGTLGREAIVDEFDRCRVSVVSSSHETFSIVVIESLIRGKPVISTKCGGPESLINETNGLLCENGSEDDLCAKMTEIVKRYDDFDEKTIVQDALEKYSEEVVTAKIQKVYTRVLASI
ncbi:MAG: glycosyltransferase [Bacteroidetes bacterium]|nr:glycosyltransferase [Bacteroidota bacterium]